MGWQNNHSDAAAKEESSRLEPTRPTREADALHAGSETIRRNFEKHGMTNVGYWKPLDEPLSKNTLIYVLAYPDREAAKKAWAAFRNDPEWVKAKEASEVNGVLTGKVDSIYLEATDYSPMK
jgi:hypothetical protein